MLDAIRQRREALQLTPEAAAERANVHPTDWQQLEDDLSVEADPAVLAAIEATLRLPVGTLARLREGLAMLESVPPTPRPDWVTALNTRFDADPLTPRQAYKLLAVLSPLDNDDDEDWRAILAGRTTPDEIWPFRDLPAWVLFLANPTWLNRFRRTLQYVARRLAAGETPYPGCVADAAALSLAIDWAEDASELLNQHVNDEGLEEYEQDDDWDLLRGALFGDLDFGAIWQDECPAAVLGGPRHNTNDEIDYQSLHPYLWWNSPG